MCQGCVDEGRLTQATYDKIETFLAAWPDSEFGPAHIVLSDANVDDGSIKFALERLWLDTEIPQGEWRATLDFLVELRAIPEDDR